MYQPPQPITDIPREQLATPARGFADVRANCDEFFRKNNMVAFCGICEERPANPFRGGRCFQCDKAKAREARK